MSRRGPGHEPARDGDHLLLAAGQRVRELPAPLATRPGTVAGRDRACSSRRVRADGLCAPSSTLSSTVRKGKRRRRSSTCARPSPAVRCAGRPSMRLPLERDAARARREQPGDGVHQRRLARAVRAEDGDDLAFVHLHRRLPQDLEVAVGDVETLDLQHRAHRSVRLAEIGLDDAPVARHGVGRAVGDLLAEIEGDDALGHRRDDPHVVLDHEEREAAAVQVADELHQAGDAALVDAAGDLVEQQHARLGRERARQLEALALAGGERARVRRPPSRRGRPGRAARGPAPARAARRASG